MKPVICIEMLYPEEEPEVKIARVADHGFDAVEFWGFRDKKLPSIAATCRRLDVRVANFSAHRVGSPVAKRTHAALLADFRDALEAAQVLDCHTLMFLSNELGEGGKVVDSHTEIPDEDKFSSFVELLRLAVESAPAGLSLVVEPLNAVADHPGNYLVDMGTAARIVREVNSPQVGILCDLYHMGMMGENLEELLRRYGELIGYVHVADFPGRHEPGTGSVDWESVLDVLDSIGYTGDVGFEYEPAGDSDASLETIRRLVSG